MPARCLSLLALLLSFALATTARAQPAAPPAVAVLPLDAEGRLEIYGQAIATELRRTLNASGIEAIVVSAKIEVPPGTQLIVDGTITEEKGGALALALRVRRVDGTVFETLSATAPALAQIDRAAAELAARVVPVVRDRVAALAAERPAPRAQERPRGPARVMLVGVTLHQKVKQAKHARLAPLRTALTDATDPWVRAASREPRSLDPAHEPPKAVAAARAERAVALEILDYDVTVKRAVPLAIARVRVRISDDQAVQFDRIVRTDTVVGARGMRDGPLAALVAQEVLAILRPHLQRLGGWP